MVPFKTMVIALFLLQIRPTGWNRVFFVAALIFAVLSMLRRREPIGGWLLYFYYWIFAVLAISLINVAMHPQAYYHAIGQRKAIYLALILTMFPRVIAIAVAAVMALLLLHNREWSSVERLRLSLVVAVIVALLSLALDAAYFPRSLYFNALRLFALLAWTACFYRSKRVRRVFQTHDWESVQQPVIQMTTDS